MPFISLRIAKKEISKSQIVELIENITTLITNVMNKKRERVSVQISCEDPDLWAVGGKLISETHGCGVRMSIDLTAGTNSIADKENMIAAATVTLDEILTINSEATYIVINEIPGESWGKGGIMLADRTRADREAQRKRVLK